MRNNPDRPVVTYAIIGLATLTMIAQLVFGDALTGWLLYFGPVTFDQPWRLLTAIFAHGGVLHLLLNMYSLFILGRMLEPALGRWRYAALFFISALGGSVAVLLISPLTPVVGASGAIFGLLGALFVLVRRTGGNTTQLVIVIAINLAIGFIVPNLAWEAHIGGLVVGAILAAIYVRTRSEKRKLLQAGLFGAVALALLATAAIRIAIW